MPLPLTKILCLGGGVAGIAAVGGTVIYLNKKDNTKQKETNQQQNTQENKGVTPKETKPIKALLKEKGKEILDKTNGDKGQWDANWVKFRDAYDTLDNKQDWEFDTLKNQNYKQISAAPQEFKDKCESNGDKLSENTKIYKNIEDYCLKTN